MVVLFGNHNERNMCDTFDVSHAESTVSTILRQYHVLKACVIPTTKLNTHTFIRVNRASIDLKLLNPLSFF